MIGVGWMGFVEDEMGIAMVKVGCSSEQAGIQTTSIMLEVGAAE